MRSDSDVKRDVGNELQWTPGLDSTDIAAAAKTGVVTLSDFVRSHIESFDAERAAKRVASMLGVANDLEVRLPGSSERTDPDIARDAVAALKAWLPVNHQGRQLHHHKPLRPSP